MALENLKQWLDFKLSNRTDVEEEILVLAKKLKKDTGVLRTAGKDMSEYVSRVSTKVDVLAEKINMYKGPHKDYFSKKLESIMENDKMNLGYYPLG